MPKVTTATVEEAPVSRPTAGVETRVLFAGPDEPIHLEVHRMQPGARLELAGRPGDRMFYVWKGGLEAAGARFGPRSSGVVEYGAALAVTALDDGAEVAVFSMRERVREDRAGGHVHLLPAERVLRRDDPKDGVGIAFHADADCPTCRLWLHEVDYHGTGEEKPHTHSADEVIFVTAGTLRLGRRAFGPGSALSIEGDTQYRFHYGPDGMSFANFRGGPSVYATADGTTRFDETELWHGIFGRPQPLVPELR
jgi:hypothetical protein